MYSNRHKSNNNNNNNNNSETNPFQIQGKCCQQSSPVAAKIVFSTQEQDRVLGCFRLAFSVGKHKQPLQAAGQTTD